MVVPASVADVTSFIEKHAQSLNPAQREAVLHTEGPLLILAGAGSGKTRVLTSRIAHLVQDRGVPLHRILAMTFSNKAAREMHERVKGFLNDDSPTRYPWISTFHSVCVRLLRQYGGRVGLEASFAIYDSNDQLEIVKDCFESLGISDKSYHPKAVHGQISNWKNEGKFPVDVLTGTRASHFAEVASRIYQSYQAELLKAQALDFDDLLLYAYRLLADHADIREHLQGLWRYVLVDEFQDTNQIQYALLKLMINPQRNIAVVGDDDQSIYGWRGAKIENILSFDKEFAPCKVVKLEQNYRSTGNILKAAAAIIQKNDYRHEKTLWTDNPAGPKIRALSLNDDREETRYVIQQIKKYHGQGVPYSEQAVLYRVNSVSRVFEEECLRQRIPYKIIGGFRFYERKEIKDVLSYLRFLVNPNDLVAFRRSVNTPPRGIGKVSMERVELMATESGKALGVLISDSGFQAQLSGKAKLGMAAYSKLVQSARKMLEGAESLTDLFVLIVEESGLLEELRRDSSEESREREENIRELLSAVQEFEEQWQPSEGPEEWTVLHKKLFDFLERVALVADTDELDASQDMVTFMSVHAAKGLEFRVCFLAALEEGIFPSMRAMDAGDDLEEERRLCYVGITRAKEFLTLSRAEARRTFGSINFQMPSRFLRDIPSEVLETIEVPDSSRSNFGSSNAYGWRKSSSPQKAKSQWPSYEDENQDVAYDDAEDGSSSFRRGDRVKHPSFGEGVVKKVEQVGSDECLTIDFSMKGRKRVLSQYVHNCER